jgi:hypothetical protein
MDNLLLKEAELLKDKNVRDPNVGLNISGIIDA